MTAWLELHGLTAEDVSDCLVTMKFSSKIFTPSWIEAISEPGTSVFLPSREDCIERFIKPSITKLLHDPYLAAEAISSIDRIQWLPVSDDPVFKAYTIEQEWPAPPAISLQWQANITDLILLAHEIAHAIQIDLSSRIFMPPIARETCAFIGELALIQWAQGEEPEIARWLKSAWLEANTRYFSDDLQNLMRALTFSEAPYDYSMNYPIARAAASMLYDSHNSDIGQLFMDGANAMKLLPIQDIARLASVARSGLPPLWPATSRSRITSEYRALGVMALLQASDEAREDNQSISEFYHTFRNYILNDNYCIAVDANNRPYGFGVWSHQTQDGGDINLCSPFGSKHTILSYIETQRNYAHNTSDSEFPIDQDSSDADFYTSIGYAVDLLSRSTHHMNYDLQYYLNVEIIPALTLGQYRYYRDLDDNPTGMVIWAWISDTVERDIHLTGRALTSGEWKCGHRLFFNDWVTPFGNTREIISDMTHNIFPDKKATGIRRNADGTVRRINIWTGINLRKICSAPLDT